MFIPTRVTLEFVTQAKGIVLRILYTHAYRDRRAACGARLSTYGGWSSWDPSVDGESFVLFLKSYVALRSHSRSRILRDKTSRDHLACAAAALVPD